MTGVGQNVIQKLKPNIGPNQGEAIRENDTKNSGKIFDSRHTVKTVS